MILIPLLLSMAIRLYTRECTVGLGSISMYFDILESICFKEKNGDKWV